MSLDRYELMERQIRSILLEDAPAGVPESLRQLIADVPAAVPRGNPGLVRNLTRLRGAGALLVAGAAVLALVAVIGLPLLSPPAAGIPVSSLVFSPSIPPQYGTDDPASQLVATGRVVDSEGRGVAGLVLFVDLLPVPPMSSQCMAGCLLTPLEAVVSAADGSFAVHLKPNAAILAAAAANGGVADFMFGPRIATYQVTMDEGFSLRVEGDRFTGLPAPISIVIDTAHPYPAITAPPVQPSLEPSAQPTAVPSPPQPSAQPS
jgi:hypothetical protein